MRPAGEQHSRCCAVRRFVTTADLVEGVVAVLQTAIAHLSASLNDPVKGAAADRSIQRANHLIDYTHKVAMEFAVAAVNVVCESTAMGICSAPCRLASFLPRHTLCSAIAHAPTRGAGAVGCASPHHCAVTRPPAGRGAQAEALHAGAVLCGGATVWRGGWHGLRECTARTDSPPPPSCSRCT